ncbi:MAG: hypothetical protein NC332_05100 [Firmicutes bacterium]|nr:hypothetical protein [Bacillota bacterium]
MHVGEMPALPFKRAFGIFPSVLLLSVSCFVISEISCLLSVGMAYLLNSVSDLRIIAAASFALLLVIRLMIAWAFMLTILAYPLKFSENYNLNVALSYSVRIMSKKKKLAWGLSFAYVAGRCLVLLLAYFIPSFYLDAVVYAVAYLLVITYVPCLAYKLYHDSVGGERRDISRKMFD